LISARVDIRAISIYPGDPDQIAFAKWMLKELGLNIPIGSSMVNRNKNSLTGLHSALLKKYKHEDWAKADDSGENLFRSAFDQFPDTEILVIGPPKATGRFLCQNQAIEIQSATIQGGFAGYGVHNFPCIKLDKFEGKNTFQSYNLNGSLLGTQQLFKGKILHKHFVSKNLNHTVVYTREIHQKMMSFKPENRAGELLREALQMQIDKYPEKKFHDPCSAVCHLHPDVATWIRARLYKIRNEWGAAPDETGDFITVDIDYEGFWEYIIHT
jgi:hypothetical protein